MALEFAAEAYEKRSGEKKINVLDGQKCLTESADDGRELLLTSRLVRAAVEVVSNIGENAVAEDTFDQDLIEKAAYEFHKGLSQHVSMLKRKPDVRQQRLVAVYFRMDYCFV